MGCYCVLDLGCLNQGKEVPGTATPEAALRRSWLHVTVLLAPKGPGQTGPEAEGGWGSSERQRCSFGRQGLA